MEAAVGWAELLRAAGTSGPTGERETLVAAALELGVDVAPGVVACSMTVADDGGWSTPHASRPVALTLDLAQYDAGTGPCIEAAATGVAQQLDSIRADRRFPGFARTAERNGVESSLSLPLIGSPRRSALNLYGDHVRTFDSRRAGAVAELLARLVVRLSTGPDPAAAVDAEVASAFERGAVVRHAVGVRARDLGVSERDAYLMFAEQSRREQRSIVELASREDRRDADDEGVSR